MSQPDDSDRIEATDSGDKNKELADAIREVGGVLLVLGLIAAAFYAKAVHMDDTYFFFLAFVVFLFKVL